VWGSGAVNAGWLAKEVLTRWVSAMLATGEVYLTEGMASKATREIEMAFGTVRGIEGLSQRSRQAFQEYRVLASDRAWVARQIQAGILATP
jgi:hypothetical protein